MHITQEKILQELGAIAFARATDILTTRDGQLVIADTGGLTPEQASAIASIEKSSGGVKVKFYDKLKALELLGKAVGLFDGGAETEEDNGLLDAILAATDGELTIDNGQLPKTKSLRGGFTTPGKRAVEGAGPYNSQ